MRHFVAYCVLNMGVGMQVALEAFGEDIDYDKLQGLWRLQYTTASDVV
jgi:uncharacterized protein YuzB (UPF0349 family)